MLVVTSTLYCSGSLTSWWAALSTMTCHDSMSSYSSETSSNTLFSVPSVIFMMLAFDMATTLSRPSARASSNARRTIFSVPLREMSLRPCATPGVSMYSIPA